MYTAELFKQKLTALYAKFGIEMPEDLTEAFKKVSGVHRLGFTGSEENTIESLFENAETAADKEYVYYSLLRCLPHGRKGIDYESDVEPEEEATVAPTPEPTPEPTTEPTADPAKIANVDTPEEKAALVEEIEGAKGSTTPEDLAKYDLDNDEDIDDDDKELASKIEVEETPEPDEEESDFNFD